MIVTDALGRAREAKTYPDGSYNCPFCMAAVMVETPAHAAHACPNPGCYARGGAGMPVYPEARARAELEESEKRQETERQRKETHEWSMRRIEENRREKETQANAVRVEALARGACPVCALESIRFGRPPKYTKHKKGCPKERR